MEFKEKWKTEGTGTPGLANLEKYRNKNSAAVSRHDRYEFLCNLFGKRNMDADALLENA